MKSYNGYILAALAAFLWGLNATVAKSLFHQAIDPGRLVEIRITGSFLVLAAGLLAWRRRQVLLPRTSLPVMAVIGINLALVQFTYFFTISLTDVATAVFLQYLSPVFLVLWEWLGEHQPLTWQKVISLVLAMTGSYLLVTGEGGRLAVTPLGLAVGLLSAVIFGAYTLITRKQVGRYDSWTVLGYAMGFGALAWSLWTPPWVAYTVDVFRSSWPGLLYVVIGGTVVPFGLFFMGLRYIPPSAATITAMLEPVVAAVSAQVFLGEIQSPVHWFGAGLILLGIVALQLSPSVPQRALNSTG